MKKKSRKKIILLLTFFAFSSFLMGAFYWSTHSQRGLKLTWAKFLYLIPGRFDWDRMNIDLIQRSVEIQNLSYTHPSGFRIVYVERFRAKLHWSSFFRIRSMFETLEIEGLTVDISGLPPRKNPAPISPVLSALSKRIAVDQSFWKNITVLFKNGSVKVASGNFRFQPTLLGKDEMKFNFYSLGGEFAEQPFSIQSMGYEGSFAAPDMIHNIFLFKEATGKYTLQGVEFGRWKLSDLSTEAAFDGETIDFKDLGFTIGKNQYRLKMKFSPFNQHADGTFETLGMAEWEEIPGFREKLARAYDKIGVKLDFDITGFSLKDMDGQLNLNAKGAGNQINPQSPNVNIQLASDIKKGRFTLTQFAITSEKTKMTGKGYVDLEQMKLDTYLSGTGFDLRTLISLFSEIEIYGYADFAGTIKGDLKNPDFRFQGKAKESGYKFLRFGENEGNFEILNGQMRYSGHSPGGSAYSDTVEVNTAYLFDGQKRRTTLKSTFNNIDISSLLENPGMTGKVQGTFDMEAAQNQKSGKLVASVKDFRMYQFHIGDMEAQGKLLNQTFSFPELSFHPPNFDKLKTPKETVFTFDDKGFKFKGSPLEGMDVDGHYLYDRKNVLDIQASCRSCSVAPFLATLEFPPLKGNVNGKIDMELIIGNFDASKMNAQIDHLEVPWGEGTLSNAGVAKITYHQGSYWMDQVNLSFGGQNAKLTGSYSTDKPINLGLAGSVDLGILKQFKEQFRDASGPAEVDLKLKGTSKEPSLNGTIDFKDATVSLRALHSTIEDLKGKITIDGPKISSEKLQGSISEGDLIVSGAVWQDHYEIKKADLRAEAREIAYSEPGNYKLILSGKVTLAGEAPHILLSGNLDITEGRYVKNFDIRDYILQPAPNLATLDQGGSGGFDSLELDLKVRSPGELLIKNNIAEIYLKSDVQIRGTKAKPVYEGAIEVLDGKLNYFKLNFENAKGFIDFRNPAAGTPYVEITAQKLFERPSEDVLVTALVKGFTDNMQLSFNSDPPLEKRDILALVFTGALPAERRSISGSSIASSVLASQLTSVLERPLEGLTGLDIFRLEASDPDSKNLSSLVVGKRLTERLSLEFKTDLSIEESIKSVQAEYQLLDNVLLLGSRSSSGKYRLDLTFRFRGF